MIALTEVNPALVRAMVKQGIVWGTSGALATKFSSDKPKTKEEKKKLLKQIAIQGLIGAGAGALGAVL